VHLVIGTHALIQEKVEFHKLGFVIVMSSTALA